MEKIKAKRMIKKYLLAVLLLQLLLACSNHSVPKFGYDYVKIITLRKTDSSNVYNKGLGMYGFFYYSPKTDSVILRRVQSDSEDSTVFQTLAGQFDNTQYTDTITRLVAYLKRHRNEDLAYVSPNDAFCGVDFFVEYHEAGHSYFKSFIPSGNDTLSQFEKFIYSLSKKSWHKEIVPNSRVNEDKEVVHMTKGLGWYDSLVYTPPYIPLPCEKGIKMGLLYGKWKTIGDKYTNANLTYSTNIIGKDGSWKIERFYKGELKKTVTGKILSISKDHVIKLKMKNEIASLKVMNLTENCFEYQERDQTPGLRLDRMQ